MWPNLSRDYQRMYAQSTYRGHWRKVLHTVTAPGFQAVCSYRLTRWLMRAHIPFLGVMIQRLTEVWTGVSIPPEAVIGPGLLILHFGGIVINNNVEIGGDCTLHHGVTIGNKVPGGRSPRLGHRVMAGVGAAILGDITVGDGAQIGANAVVVQSVPPGGVAVGIPAKTVRII